MADRHETDKPLVLLKRGEVLVAKAALEHIFEPEYPRIRELRDAIAKEDSWQEEFAMVYRGAPKAVLLYALHEVVVAPETLTATPSEFELWQQAGAAQILGEHFASLIVPKFTAKVIAKGLIHHDPAIEGPISASMPVFIAA